MKILKKFSERQNSLIITKIKNTTTKLERMQKFVEKIFYFVS